MSYISRHAIQKAIIGASQSFYKYDTWLPDELIEHKKILQND